MRGPRLRYTVLDTVKWLDGKKQVEALVPNYSPGTSLEFVTEAAKQVAEKEKADVVLLFTTKDAQKAVYRKLRVLAVYGVELPSVSGP